MTKTVYTNDEINSFLTGRDPQEGITSVECGYNDNEVSVIYRIKETGQRYLKKEPFKPFLWAKTDAAKELFGGDRTKLIKAMDKFGIGVKSLNIFGDNGFTTDRIRNGFKLLFFSKKPMSNTEFQKFFRIGGVNLYKNNGFMSFTPVEQFLISTGKRLFKGYDDYDELVRFQFDLETMGLNPNVHPINQIGISTNKGFVKIITIEGERNSEERLTNELNGIKEFLSIIRDLKPDVIAGHNSFNFDWDFLFVRCSKLGVDLNELSKAYFKEPITMLEKPGVLKLGGETEFYKQTVLWGHSIVDSMHAVRRAMAIDSNIKQSGLKYITKYSGLNKYNRVYVDGRLIDKTWSDKENDYAINEENGDWYKITPETPLSNGYNITSGKYIVERYLSDDLYETDKVELTYNQSNFLLSKMIPTTFTRACTMGTASIWKLILSAWSYENGLAIPDVVEKKKFTGGLSRLLKVGYVDRVVKLDYNSLYPAIMLTFGISPDSDISGVMLQLLEFILSERERFKGLMKIAKTKASTLEKNLPNVAECDVQKIKNEIQAFKAEANAFDKKQLPFKIFGNSFFGSFGAQNIFNWGETMAAEEVTCTGRQALRLMISWFSDRGFEPIVGDTDGFNFRYPKDVDNYKYIGKGLNRNTKEGVTYQGVEAYTAEFNDLFMRNKMGLGIDEYAEATINFGRKNYADLLIDNKSGKKVVKLVGNTIKSKKMATYIEDFINRGVENLLNSKGKCFLDEYYNFIDNIYNLRIPLCDIASKGRVKISVDEYKEKMKGKTSNGSSPARQAHMELIIKNNIKVDVGDVVYYINIGKRKSHGDVKLNKKTNEVEFNCVLIPLEYIDDSVKYIKEFGELEIEYNVEKYIEQFNKRVAPLLVCFSPEIRNNILAKTPSDRKYFTDEQCELVSGYPIKEEHQDVFYDNLMKMEDKEIKFWIERNKKPAYIDEIGYSWSEIVSDFNIREKDKQKEEIKIEIAMLEKISENITEAQLLAFYNEGIIPNSVLEFCELDVKTKQFISLKHNVPIGDIYLFIK